MSIKQSDLGQQGENKATKVSKNQPEKDLCGKKLPWNTFGHSFPLEDIRSNTSEITKVMLPNVMYEPVLAIRLLLLRQADI